LDLVDDAPIPKPLILCADDFGLARHISVGIAGLAHAERINAVSCITNAPQWPDDAHRLHGLPSSVALGLHLNLTDGTPLSPRLRRKWPRLPSLSKLILLSHLRELPRSELRAELRAQYTAFVDATGRQPDFMDGHQHVHHLPVIREMLLTFIEHLPDAPAVRNTGRILGAGYGFKRWMIEHTGGRALAAELKRRGLRHNPFLMGVYDFKHTVYRRLMRAWLKLVPPEGALIICHPGEASLHEHSDPIAPARERELAYLESTAFEKDLIEAQVRLVPMSRSVDLQS
jgi:chitin disaccharide deacetylase